MFRYLIFFAAAFYLTLLIAGEDRGQKRMGLAGAYTIPLAPPPAEASPEPMAEAPVTAPAATLRVLPAPQPDAVLQTASAPAETAAPAPSDSPTVTLRTITADAANVREGANRNAAVIGRVERGEIVQMVETVGDWVHIRIEGDGTEGFVHRRLISSEPPRLTTSTLFPIAD